MRTGENLQQSGEGGAVERIRARLFALQDEPYRRFSAKLTPTLDIGRVIGVRTPALRTLAKELRGTPDAAQFLAALPRAYYEENNLHGFLIEGIRDYDACVAALNVFLPYVDNWATCDMLKPRVFQKHRARLAGDIERWLSSGETYTVRFGMGMVMSHFLGEDFSEVWLERVAQVRSEEYYVNMMQAWFFATALGKQWDAALRYVTERRLSSWVHNRTIQKAVESRRITPEQKELLRGWRIREKNGA